jgi:zinc transporter 7
LLIGFMIFFCGEKIANYTLSGRGHDHSNGRGHSKKEDEPVSPVSPLTRRKTRSQKDSDEVHVDQNKNNSNSSSSSSSSSTWNIFRKLEGSGWLNLVADSMHNFTDGLAIGAAFSSGSGKSLAAATFFSVICHEIPHEIGDFTILMQNGLSKTEAIQAQFVTAVAALIGTLVGLLLAEQNKVAEDLMLAFTSGGFLYIATVTVIPNISSCESSLSQIFAEMVAFVAGIGMMVAVTLLEEHEH